MENNVVKENLHGLIRIKLHALMDVVRKKVNVCFWVANAVVENDVVKEDLHGPISIKLNALMDVVQKKLNVCF